MSLPPAGWHPDPQQPGMLRYWDGSQWTDYQQPAVQPPTQQSQGRSLLAYFLLAWGVLSAIAALGAVIDVQGAVDELSSEGNPFAGLAFQAVVPRVVSDVIFMLVPAGVMTGLEAWGRSQARAGRSRTAATVGQAVVGVGAAMLIISALA